MLRVLYPSGCQENSSRAPKMFPRGKIRYVQFYQKTICNTGKKNTQKALVEIIFSSLQVIKNSYRNSFEKTNLLSKDILNMYFLYFFYYEMLVNRLFFVQAPNLTPRFFALFRSRRRYYSYSLERFFINSFVFMSSRWCAVCVKIMSFAPLNITSIHVPPLPKARYLRHPHASVSRRS